MFKIEKTVKIITPGISEGAVTTEKIADGAVTSAKLAKHIYIHRITAEIGQTYWIWEIINNRADAYEVSGDLPNGTWPCIVSGLYNYEDYKQAVPVSVNYGNNNIRFNYVHHINTAAELSIGTMIEDNELELEDTVTELI